MRLIIDINEENWQDICNIHFVREDLKFKIGEAIMKGIPQEPKAGWIPVKTINQCYISELKDFHGKVLATYYTGKCKRPQVTAIAVSYGRIENKKFTDISAIMFLPEPYKKSEG